MILELNNFKGQNSKVELSKINYFCGENGSGKTAHLEGLQLVLSGQTNSAKSTKDLFDLYSDSGKDFSIKVSSGDFTIERIFKKEKGSVKQEVYLNGKKKSTSAIKELLAEKFMDSIDFNIGNFLSYSNEKQKKFLLDLCSGGGKISDIKGELIQLIKNDEIKKEIESKSNLDIEEGLNKILEETKTKINQLQAYKQKLNATEKIAMDFKQEDLSKLDKNISELKIQYKKNTEYISNLNSEIGKAEGATIAINRLKRNIKEKEEELKKTKETIKKLEGIKREDFESKKEKLKLKIEEYKKELQFINFLYLTFEDNKCPFSENCSVDIETQIEEYQEKEMKIAKELKAITKDLEVIETKEKKYKNEVKKPLEYHKKEISKIEKEIMKSEKSLEELYKETGNADIEGLKKEIEVLKRENEILEDRLEKQNRIRETSLVEQHSRLKLIEAKKDLEVLKNDYKTIGFFRNKLLKDSIKPLEDMINKQLQDINKKYRISFFDDEGIYNIYCINKNGTEAILSVLSGGEKAIFYTALITGLINLKKSNKKIVLADVSEIDFAGINYFLEYFKRNEDLFDYVLVAHWYSDINIENINIVRL